MDFEELRKRVLVLDAGNPVSINQYIIEEDDECPRQHRYTVERVDHVGSDFWVIKRGNYVLTKSKEWVYNGIAPNTSYFPSPDEALEFLRVYKVETREKLRKDPVYSSKPPL